MREGRADFAVDMGLHGPGAGCGINGAILRPLNEALPGGVSLMLLLEGCLYTVGVTFHVWERLPFQNAIWHPFVLAGAGVHFAAVAVSL